MTRLTFYVKEIIILMFIFSIGQLKTFQALTPNNSLNIHKNVRITLAREKLNPHGTKTMNIERLPIRVNNDVCKTQLRTDKS